MNESTGAKKLSGLAPLKEMLLYLSAFPIATGTVVKMKSWRLCGLAPLREKLRLLIVAYLFYKEFVSATRLPRSLESGLAMKGPGILKP
jgi:hypothetical protein